MDKRKIAFVVNNVAFFVSHRLPLADKAISLGWETLLVTGRPGSLLLESEAIAKLNRHSVKNTSVGFSSSGVNPIAELWSFLKLVHVLRHFKPDIIHAASPKGVIYGGLAGRLLSIQNLTVALTGMGYLHTDGSKSNFLKSFLRFVVGIFYRFIFSAKNINIIVQNLDDKNYVVEKLEVPESKVTLIKGSGVDLAQYSDCSPSHKSKIIVLPARMLVDKGVLEFIGAAKVLRDEFKGWKFILAGTADYKNPAAIDEAELQAMCDESGVEWLGHVSDMPQLYRKAAIVCLPSYREGMPKVLLEGAAAGCALISTYAPGCREAVQNGVSGELITPHSTKALISCLRVLLPDEKKIYRYGLNAQNIALQQYDIAQVVQKTFKIYEGRVSE
jgi:glycosyltransferase involved in cell wall biosynthesis